MKSIFLAAIAPLFFSSTSASANLLHDLVMKKGGVEKVQVERLLDEQLFSVARSCRDAGGQPRELIVAAPDAEVTRSMECAHGANSVVIDLAGSRDAGKQASFSIAARFQWPVPETEIGLIESDLLGQIRTMNLSDVEACATNVADAPSGALKVTCSGAAINEAYTKASAARYAPWTAQAKEAKEAREKAFATPSATQP